MERDWVVPLIIFGFLLMWPVSGGYFYHRPFCIEAPDRAGCAFVAAIPWPVTLPANIAARFFE